MRVGRMCSAQKLCKTLIANDLQVKILTTKDLRPLLGAVVRALRIAFAWAMMN
jgi:hypothetical protein